MKSWPLFACGLCINIFAFAQPKNMILYIGDGFGLAPKTAARMALGQGQEGKRVSKDPQFQVLALDKLKYQSTVTTHSLNSWITDSAPGATVYACGQKIDNEMISLHPVTGLSLETILEQAKKAGYAVGLVTNTRVTHATPAAFSSHIWSRDLEDFIACQQLCHTKADYEGLWGTKYQDSIHWTLPKPKVNVQLDVLLGGGMKHFLPEGINDTLRDGLGNVQKDDSNKPVILKGKRKDGVNLWAFAQKQDFKTVNTRASLLAIEPEKLGKGSLLGIFSNSHMSYEQDRQLFTPWEPSLAEMVEVAIKVLTYKGGKKGFFLMVEGGRIDHLGHANAGCTHKENDLIVLEADSAAFPPDLAGNRLKKTSQGEITGADYMIKEVISFDHAVEVGRKFMKNPNLKAAQTFILSTSDHETGGFAITGLHDEASKQAGGTGIRTYAEEVKQAKNQNAKPQTLIRGDAPQGWFPEYTNYTFQGQNYPKPAHEKARRLVVAFGSNPWTNGNGIRNPAVYGNHTPQDIWVGADDNMNGKMAEKITGRGLMDNTDLHGIMQEFLQLYLFAKPLHQPNKRQKK